jgi:2-C-methyl-D-erythritol 4-phosphate cytidylyltransferase
MTSSPRDVGVVIAAGGRGERAGTTAPKQFREIAGVPMLLRAIRPFAAHPRVADIVVPLPADVVDDPPKWLRDLAGDRLRMVAGGATRAASVASGVAALSEECTFVLVHDAARPFVSPDTVNAIIELVTAGTCAIAAVPVSDTIKRSGPDGERVLETVRREGLWRAQTPQGFPRQALEQAYAHQDLSTVATDEAALVEAVGIPVVLVRDSTSNMKVTMPEDFLVAEALATRS